MVAPPESPSCRAHPVGAAPRDLFLRFRAGAAEADVAHSLHRLPAAARAADDKKLLPGTRPLEQFDELVAVLAGQRT